MTIRIPPCLVRATLCVTLLTAPGISAYAQAIPAGANEHADIPQAESTSSSTNEVPLVPGLSSLLHGVNGGVTISGVHDAAVGWATLVTPAFGYSFNDTFSADISIPFYMFRLAESRSANPRRNAQLVTRRAELGDVVLAVHAQLPLPWVNYQSTLSATAPTGDPSYGLTSGRSTLDFSNQLNHEFRRVTPSIELGVGDSTTLVNRLVTKNYTSLGPLAHFQAGVAIPLMHGASFESDVYEQLPIGDQKIYSSTTRRHTTTTVVTGRTVTEDNGFITAFNLPVDAHTTLTSYYSRSLRFHDDVVSIGLSYVLRGSKPPEQKNDSVFGKDSLR